MAKFRSITVTNTATNVTNKGADVKSINIINRHNAAIFVKFYNSDTATFQDTPAKVFQVAASSYYPASPIVVSNQGTLFSVSDGLSVRVTTSATDSDNTAAATLPIIELEYN
jgi:esterase/lipase superfamily enzyme